jgi:transposase
VKWEEVKNKSEEEIRKQLFPRPAAESLQVQPDFKELLKEYDTIPGITKKVLWEDYVKEVQAAGGIPYQYSQFCELFGRAQAVNSAAMHQQHKPGERIEVDWAGTKVPIIDPDTGEITWSYMFVAVLPYSQYAYAEVLPDMKLESWIGAHIKMFEFFRGVTPILFCDNLKTGILSHPEMGDWVENASYREMADYYDTAILAAPVRTPKAKASVEGTVGKLTSKIIARLYKQKPGSIWEANKKSREFLNEFNAARFEKREGSRLEEFMTIEKPLLHSLPREPYEYGIWKTATVQLNYHIAIDRMYYSVPYRYIHQKVRVRISKYKVDIYLNGSRITSHSRLYGHPGQYSTKVEHMPDNHKKALEWNGDRFRRWARSVGPSTYQVIDQLLRSYKIEEQGYNACMSILKFADKYTPERLEKTCAKALSVITMPRYKDIKLILVHDQEAVSTERSEKSSDESHAIMRGSKYYGGRY